MQRAITLTHKKIKRDFIISNKTKPNTLKNLLKKALRLQAEIKYFKTDGNKLSIEQLISQSRASDYEVVLEDDSSQDKSKSEVSQKNMSKVSGRKNPPSEHELVDSKFYIDDFQLFMAQASAKKTTKLFGIVFFNNRKKASFLGKKILRELIFQFDKIQFFYALHPIKMHTSSALLGEVLVFALFRGKVLVHEREFPEQITAADQIPNYIKNLVKIGQLSFDTLPLNQHRKPKNLIHVHEQRSFDHQIQDSPEKLSDFGNRPNRTTEIIKIKPITPDKQLKARKIFANPKVDSGVKSPITNQISFENDFYQPEWFFQGDALTRLEKGILSALIKNNDSSLLTFINGLTLKDKDKEKLNIKLVKVFLKQYGDQKLCDFSAQQKAYIEQNQQNRKSFVFNALLKLYKFGDLKDFIQVLTKGIASISDQTQSKIKAEPKVLYSAIVKNTEKLKSGFTIKLKNCQSEFDSPTSPYKQHSSPFREQPQVHRFHTQIAKNFYDKALPNFQVGLLKTIDLGKQYQEGERAAISDLLCKNDAFLTECLLPRSEKSKKVQKIPSKTIKRYLRQVESRYQKIRIRTVADPHTKLKMHKLQIFNGLVYFLYKQRVINKKQLKISFYLYTWSDLNVLSAFELYLLDRNLEELVDTLYAIDYNYYLNGLYEIDHSEVEQFTLSVEEQLIILFLYQNYIDSGDQRISLQKFIRAGDTSLLELYTDLTISNEDLIRRMIQLSKIKKQQLDNINRSENRTIGQIKQKKIDRCSFIDQVVSHRYKNFHKKELVKYCINHDEPIITSLFDLLDQNNQQTEWIDSFNHYISRIDQIHMKVVIQELAKEANIDLAKIQSCKSEIIKAIYEAYIATNDKSDTIDSLERAVRKVARANSPVGTQSPK